jgi:dTDP-4-dehydrorhamnose reductase
MDKLLVLGGSGKLGKFLLEELNLTPKIQYNAPSSLECDITDFNQLESVIKTFTPNIIIHTAGFVDTTGCENDKQKCLDINVLGTLNVVKLCRKYSIRLVYISSEYVFDGTKSSYTPESALKPINTYGISKACGELIVKTLDNYLIIRAPFIRKSTFPYEYAFIDQYTCRQYVDEISSDIIKNTLSKTVGIVHIVGKYQSVYELAKKTNPNVKPIQINEDLKQVLPTYLNLISNNSK